MEKLREAVTTNILFAHLENDELQVQSPAPVYISMALCSFKIAVVTLC